MTGVNTMLTIQRETQGYRKPADVIQFCWWKADRQNKNLGEGKQTFLSGPYNLIIRFGKAVQTGHMPRSELAKIPKTV